MYYFGCIGQPGHHLWNNQEQKLWRELPTGFPRQWTAREHATIHRRLVVDENAIAPNVTYGTEGLAKIQHVEGWTCVSFPDRSVDHRPNCVSAFIEIGTLTFEDIMVKAAEEFPSVIDRFEFVIEMAA